MVASDKEIMEDEILLEQFTQHFVHFEKHHPGIDLHLTWLQAWAIMANIQLACRHPENVGPTRQQAEAIARVIQQAIATTPALATVAEQGWNNQDK